MSISVDTDAQMFQHPWKDEEDLRFKSVAELKDRELHFRKLQQATGAQCRICVIRDTHCIYCIDLMPISPWCAVFNVAKDEDKDVEMKSAPPSDHFATPADFFASVPLSRPEQSAAFAAFTQPQPQLSATYGLPIAQPVTPPPPSSPPQMTACAPRSPAQTGCAPKPTEITWNAPRQRNIFVDGWAYHDRAFSREFIGEINKLPVRNPTYISGGYQQENWYKILPKKLKQRIFNEVRRHHPEIPPTYVFHQIKLLYGDPGCLEQICHVDSMERKFVTIILHLNESTDPSKPIHSTEIGKTAPHPPFNPKAPNWPRRWPRAAEEFHKFIAHTGSFTILTTDQPHRAPANTTGQVRKVLFLVLGPPFTSKKDRYDDTFSGYEFYYHMMHEELAELSEPCLESLKFYYNTHNPLNHYQHLPKLAARWREILDPNFALWIKTRLKPLLQDTRREFPLSAQDRTYAERAWLQGVITEEEYKQRFTGRHASKTN